MTGKKQLPPVWVAGDDDLPGAINEPAEKVTPLSLHDAAESGTRLDELRALRRILIAHISSENILARDLSSLTLKLMAISKEIESLAAIEAEASTHGQQEVSKLDAEDEDFNPHSA